MGYMISKDQIDEAAVWAGAHVEFDTLEVLREMPWGVTARLMGPDEDHYLKILPKHLSSVVPKTTAINKLAPEHTAEIVASEPAKNWLLFADHQGKRLSSSQYHQQCMELLHNYAKLQASAAEQKQLLDPVPRLTWKKIWNRALEFVSQGKSPSDTTASLSDFLGQRESDFFANALLICKDPIAGFVKPSFRLPLTINHGDLHTNNAAIQPNGEIVFHDWDSATAGPAGLSLNGISPSIAGLIMASLMGGSVSQADDLVGHYIETLSEQGYADSEKLEAGIPGAAFCGLLNSLTAYMEFPPIDESDWYVCCPDIQRICNDLVQCCILLAAQDKKTAIRFADLLSNHQRLQDLSDLTDLIIEIHGEADFLSDRTFQLDVLGHYSQKSISSIAAISNSLFLAEQGGTVPTIHCQRSDRVDSDIRGMKASAAQKMFSDHGCLVLDSAFSTDVLNSCREQYALRGGNGTGTPLNVGHQRYMEPLNLAGAFNSPEVYACPSLMPVLSQLLGPEFVLGSATLVVSSPGAEDQHKHIDHPHLFSDQDAGHLPPHAITVLIPLVDIDEKIGGTAVVKGSHRVPMDEGKSMPVQSQNLQLGSCLLFDYRLYHYGLANRSKKDRPVISLVYQRPWFRDAKNFDTQAPLQMSADDFAKVPEDLRPILSHLATQQS